MNKLPLLCLFLFFSGIPLLHSQQVEVRYYVQGDSIAYYVDGKRQTRRPKVRRDEEVTVRIINFNNYLYKPVIEEENKQIWEGGLPAASMSSLVPSGMGSGPTASLMGSLFAPDSKLPFDAENFDEFAEDAEGGGMIEARATTLYNNFKAEMKKVDQTEAKLKSISSNMEELLLGQQIQAITAKEVASMRFDPLLPPTEIKRLSMEYMETVLGVKGDEPLELKQLAEQAKTKDKFQKSFNDYQKQIDVLSAQIDTIGSISAELSEAEDDRTNFAAMRREVTAYHAAGIIRLKEYEAGADAVKAEIPKVQDLGLEPLVAMRRNFESVRNNDFSHTYRAIASGDDISFDLKLEPLSAGPDSLNKNGLTTRKLSTIKLPVYGGFKVNVSVGISFASLFDSPKKYFVRDSTIVGQDTDSFVPVVTSFVHFYRQGGGNISLGGTFGLGLPLTTNDSPLSGATFFFGPSLVLGRGERVTLNGGLMGGRVERLAKGYQVGDPFELTTDDLTTVNSYELGYFFGISFNLLSQ